MVGISIALLSIYGADVIATETTGEGFLTIDHKTRGLGLGLPSIILPFVALFVAKGQASAGLGAAVLVSGVLILVGGLAVLGLAEPPEPDSARNVAAEALPLVGIGAVISALGIIKIVRSRSG